MGICIFVGIRFPTLIAFEQNFVEYVHHEPMGIYRRVVSSAVGALFFVLYPVSYALAAVELVTLAALHWIPHNLHANLANKLRVEIQIKTLFWLKLSGIYLFFKDFLDYVCNLA